MSRKIRKALESDLESLYNIEKQDEDAWSYGLFSADFLRSSFSRYLVAEDDGEILGFVAFMNISGEIHINNIIVDPKHRKKGIGLELLEAVIDYYKDDKDVMGITLEVRVDNVPAISLYEKLGFVEVGYREKYYKNNKDAYIMWKVLREDLCTF